MNKFMELYEKNKKYQRAGKGGVMNKFMELYEELRKEHAEEGFFAGFISHMVQMKVHLSHSLNP